MWPAIPWHRTRSLRVRLTVAYTAFFALLLIVLGMLFRQTLSNVFFSQIGSALEEDAAALMSHLRFADGSPEWYFDEKAPDEAAVVERLRRMLLITDANGNRLEA